MIGFISSWAEQIIIAVIIATIIEMIIPKGNNKKYIKVVIGVYILFTIVAPIIQKISGKDIKLDMNYEQYFSNAKEYETMSNAISNTNDKNIEEIYIQNLKNDIKTRVKEKGYNTTNIEVDINLENNSSYGNINKIVMYIKENQIEENTIKNEISIGAVNKVTIGNTIHTNETKSIEQDKINEIKEYLSSIYSVNTEYIIIN